MRHLYVHVPFCARRCTYCDFAIAVRKRVPAARFVDAVLEEYDRRRHGPDWDDEPLETLYLGGGTPSLLDPNQLTRLVVALVQGESVPRSPRPTPRSGPTLEITLEANPDDVTVERATAWRDAGVTRVSLGAQSFDPDVLRWMHRTHAAERTAEAVATLRDAAPFSVSLDLIFARPEGMAGSFRRDLERALTLVPEHLSVYGLTVEPGTALGRWVRRNEVRPAAEDRYAGEFLAAHGLLSAAGYEHYEVSNYARPGHRSRHNQAYWSGRPYAGLGPAAHSYRAPERWWNVREWAAYDRLMRAGADPMTERETLDRAALRLERVYLGLRTVEGVPLREEGGAGGDTLPNIAGIAPIAAQGWVEVGPQRLRSTPEGWLRLDELVTVLTTSVEGG